MSNVATRISLAKARGLVDELVSLLSPVCERIEIAGSIRRERPDVGDVEIVAIPKTIPQFRSAGGLCPSNLEVKGWRVRRRDTHEPINTPEESDVFEAMGMLCPEPWFRTDTYQPVRLNHV